MRDSKLFLFIAILSENQLDLIHTQLKKEKGKISYDLFKLMLELKKKIFSREIIFIKIFKKKHTSENDYLLRNEMSRLEDKIEMILVEDYVSKEIKKNKIVSNYYKLRVFQELQLSYKMEEILENQKKCCNDENNFDEIYKSNLLYADLLKVKSNSYTERSEKLSAIYEDCINLFYKDVALKYAQLQHLESLQLYAQRQASKEALNFPLQRTEDTIQINTIEHGSVLSKYHKLLAQCYFNLDYKRENMEVFFECVQLIELHIKDVFLLSEYAVILGLIATKLSILGKFNEAEIYFKKCLEKIPPSYNLNYAAVVVNYASNLIKHDKADDALKLLKAVPKNLIDDNPNIKSHYSIRLIMCYLQLKNDAALNELLMKADFTALQPFEKIYYKLSACNVFVMRNDFERALEEINNLIRSKLLNEIDDDFKPVAEFLQYVFQQLIKYHTVKKIPLKMISEIKNKIEEIENHAMPQMKHYTPFQWVLSELKLR